MKFYSFPRDIRVIFPRVPLGPLAGSLLALSGGFAAAPARAQTTISTPQTPTYTATTAGTPYTINSGATFNNGSSDGIDADGTAATTVSVTVNGGDFSSDGGDGYNANADTTTDVTANSTATFTNNTLNGLETAGTATIGGGTFNDNGSNTTGSNDSGLQADSGANITINNGTFETNGFHASLPTVFTGISDGNGLEADDATINVGGGVFNDNGSFGVLAQDGAQVTLSGGSAEYDLNGDQQVQYGGFGVGAFGAATTLNAEEGYYDDNVNGGLFADAATVTISSGAFDNNGNYGAWVNDGAQLTVNEGSDTPAPSFDNNSSGIGLEVDEDDVNGNAPATADTTANITAGDYTGNGLDGLRTQGGATVNISGSTMVNLSGATVSTLLAFDGGSTGSQVNGLEDDGSTVNISAGQFNSNHDDGVYYTSGSLTISGNTAGGSDPTFDNNGYAGVNIFGSSANPNTITAGDYSSNGVDGVQVSNGGSLTIGANTGNSPTDDATFDNNGNNGLAVVDNSSATITAGSFDNNGSGTAATPVANSDGVYVDSTSSLNINTDEANNPGDFATFNGNVRAGVEVYGTANITDGTFDSNGDYGLAVGLDGQVTVGQDTNSGDAPTFESNSLSGAGDFGGTLNVSAGTFNSNTDDGLYVGTFTDQSNTVTPGNATVSANPLGGADPVFDSNGTNGLEAEGSTVTITAGQFGANGVGNVNDGVYAGNGSIVNINTDNTNNPGDFPTFEYNGKDGLEVQGSTATITDGTFNNNTANNNVTLGGGFGDGLLADNSTVTIAPDTNSGHTPTFDDNNFGINTGGSTVSISGGDYSSNFFDGALVFAPGGSVTISTDPNTGDMATFENNFASGLQVSQTATATITSGTFENNNNAGVLADHNANVTIGADLYGSTPTFDNNSVAGLQSDGSMVTITAGDFSSNINSGDGVKAFDGSTLNINTDETNQPGRFPTFNSNSGSGVEIDASKATITDGNFEGNTLWGVLAQNGSTLTIEADPNSSDTPTFDSNGLPFTQNGMTYEYDGVKVDDSTATVTAGTFNGNGANGLYVTDGSTVNINADTTLYNDGAAVDYPVFQQNGYGGLEVGDSNGGTDIANITDGEFGDNSGTTYAGGGKGNAENGLFAFNGAQVTIGQDQTNTSEAPSFDGNGANGVLLSANTSYTGVASTATITAGDFSDNGLNGLQANNGSTVTINANSLGSDPTFENNGSYGLDVGTGSAATITAGNFSGNTLDGAYGNAGSTITVNEDPSGNVANFDNNVPAGGFTGENGLETAGTATITAGNFNGNAGDGLVADAGSTVAVETGSVTVGSATTPTATYANFYNNVNGLQAQGTNGATPGAVVNVTDGFFDNNSNAGLIAYGGSTVTIDSDALGVASNNQPQFFDNTNAQLEAALGATVNVTDANFNDFGVANPTASGVLVDGGSIVNLNEDPNGGYIVAYSNYDGIDTSGTVNVTAGSYSSNTNDGLYGTTGSTINISEDPLGGTPQFGYVGQTPTQINGVETAGTATITAGSFAGNSNDGLLADTGSNVTVEGGVVTVSGTPTDTVATFNNNGNAGIEAANGVMVNITAADIHNNTNDGIVGAAGSIINLNSDANGGLIGDYSNIDGVATSGTVNITDGDYYSNTNDGVYGSSGSIVNIGSDPTTNNFPLFAGQPGSPQQNGLETVGTANISSGQFAANVNGVLADPGAIVNITPDMVSNKEPIFGSGGGQLGNTGNGVEATGTAAAPTTVNISDGGFFGNGNDGILGGANTTINSETGTVNNTLYFASFTGNKNGLETAGTANISAGNYNSNTNDGALGEAGSTINVNPSGNIADFSSNVNGLETSGMANVNTGQFTGNSNDGLLADAGSIVNVHDSSFTPVFTGNTANGLAATDATVNITAGTFGAAGTGNANGNDGLLAQNGSTVTIGPDSDGATPTFENNAIFGAALFDTTATITAGTFTGNGLEGLVATSLNTGGSTSVTITADSATGDTPTFDSNLNNGMSAEGGNGTGNYSITAGQFNSNSKDGLFDTDGANVTIGADTTTGSGLGDTPTFDNNGTSGIHVSSNTDGFTNISAPSALTISAGDFSGNGTNGVLEDAGSTVKISGGTFNGLPTGATSGTVQQNGLQTSGMATITGGTFNGNSNDGVLANTGSNVTVSDPPASTPAFDSNKNNGFETSGTAFINAGDFSDNTINGLAAELGAAVTINGGTFDDDGLDGLFATGSTTDVNLYGGSFLSDATDLSAVSDATIYVYGTDLGFYQPTGLQPSDVSVPPSSGFITGYLANNPNTLVNLSYNIATGGQIILVGANGNPAPTVPEPSPLALAGLPLGAMLLIRARRRMSASA